MDLREYDSATCSVARALDVVGQPWVLLVLREAFHGLRRFSAGVNTRIHGTLMCTAAEIPGVCIWHDTRTQELTHEMRLPALSVRTFTENRYSVRDL